MKKILIAGMAALGLVLSGCTESKTGLKKNVINTALDTCKTYLSGGLKSPSSLRISGVSAIVQRPDLSDISDVFGDIIIENNKITEIARDNKARYRELLMVIGYEAQNSYGVYLSGTYQCKYLYELNSEEVSPEPLNIYLIALKSDGDNIDMEGIHIPIAKLTGSNISLDKNIKTIISSADGSFSKQDEQVYIDLIKQKKARDQELKAKQLKKSWDEMNASEISALAEADAAAAAAAVAVEAAEYALSAVQDEEY